MVIAVILAICTFYSRGSSDVDVPQDNFVSNGSASCGLTAESCTNSNSKLYLILGWVSSALLMIVGIFLTVFDVVTDKTFKKNERIVIKGK